MCQGSPCTPSLPESAISLRSLVSSRGNRLGAAGPAAAQAPPGPAGAREHVTTRVHTACMHALRTCARTRPECHPARILSLEILGFTGHPQFHQPWGPPCLPFSLPRCIPCCPLENNSGFIDKHAPFRMWITVEGLPQSCHLGRQGDTFL